MTSRRSGRDLREIDNCVYMVDLMIRELMNSPYIADKGHAQEIVIKAFVDILRHEGYPLTRTRLRDMLAFTA